MKGKNMKKYLYEVRWAIVVLIAIAFMVHGAILFSQRFGIDTDFIMNGEHNFLLICRQGLVWLAVWR